MSYSEMRDAVVAGHHCGLVCDRCGHGVNHHRRLEIDHVWYFRCITCITGCTETSIMGIRESEYRDMCRRKSVERTAREERVFALVRSWTDQWNMDHPVGTLVIATGANVVKVAGDEKREGRYLAGQLITDNKWHPEIITIGRVVAPATVVSCVVVTCPVEHFVGYNGNNRASIQLPVAITREWYI